MPRICAAGALRSQWCDNMNHWCPRQRVWHTLTAKRLTSETFFESALEHANPPIERRLGRRMMGRVTVAAYLHNSWSVVFSHQLCDSKPCFPTSVDPIIWQIWYQFFALCCIGLCVRHGAATSIVQVQKIKIQTEILDRQRFLLTCWA